MTDEFTAFSCHALGVHGTTNIFVRKIGEHYVARVGLAIMGQTNMKEADLKDANPFNDSFQDNYAEGIGDTEILALEALKADVKVISETLWL